MTYDPSPLERLAFKAGLDDDELRELLRRIAERQREELSRLAKGRVSRVTCAKCGDDRVVSYRHAQRVRAGEALVCERCRRPVRDPGEREARWVESLSVETREGTFAALEALAS